MKRCDVLMSLVFLLNSFALHAALPDGATAPNFTVSDINGTTYNLYNILDSGKPVVIDFSATWCGICWNYHTTHILDQLYTTYGPGGTNQIMVLFIEGDLSTSQNCLYGPSGCTGGSIGNWVQGSPYPIINLSSTNGQNVASSYQVSYFPTLYAISPDRRAYEVGTASLTTWQSWLFQSFNLSATAAITNASCGGSGSIDLTVTGGYQNLTYLWSNGATTQDITGLAPGSYTVVITDEHGYTITKEYTVTGSSQALFFSNTTVNQVSCNGGSNGAISVSVSGGLPPYNYIWSNNNTTSAIINLSSGTYTVTVTDLQPCTLIQSFNLPNPPPINSMTVVNPATCTNNNGSVVINAIGGSTPYTYALSNGASGSSNQFSNLAAGNYGFTITDVNNCTSSNSFIIEAVGQPTSQSASPGNLNCAITQVTLNGSGSSTGSNFTYLWTTSNGHIVSGETTLNPIVDDAGTYNLKVTNTSNGCTANSNVIVTENTTPPAITVPNGQLTCAVNSVQLCANATAGSIVTWNLNGTNTQSNCVMVSAAGNYVATAVAANGCSASATSVVTSSSALPQISAQPAPQLTCLLTQTTLMATLNGNVADFLIGWATTDGNIVSGSTTLNPVVDDDGLYTLTVKNISTQCMSMLNVTVTEFLNIPTGQFTSINANGLLTLNASPPPTGNVTWNWDNQQASGNSVTISFPVTGVYTICMTMINECGEKTQCKALQYYTAFAVQGQITHNKCFGTNTAAIIAQTSGGPVTGNISYNWTGPNGFTSSQSTIANLIAGIYQCSVSDEAGLFASNTFHVTEPPDFAISPNITHASGGLNNGSITLNLSGGTAPYTYMWTNGSNQSNIQNLSPGIYFTTVADANMCQKIYGPFTIQNGTSSFDQEIVEKFVVYPNPASKMIQLEFQTSLMTEGTIEIFALDGKKRRSISFNGNQFIENIDIAEFPNGIYLLVVKTQQGLYTRKFYKEI